MNWFMDIWFILCFAIPLIVIHQYTKGKSMTWREFFFFLFGLFMIGIPFIYLTNH